MIPPFCFSRGFFSQQSLKKPILTAFLHPILKYIMHLMFIITSIEQMGPETCINVTFTVHTVTI